MSITTTKDVFCDFCPDWTHCCCHCNDNDARKIAKQKGWKYIKVDGKMGDICPKCQKERGIK